MSTRVNLMKPGEFRRQGAVSGTFIVQMSIFTTIALGVLFGGLAFVNYRNARADLMASRQIWKTREPLYNKIQAMKADVAELRKIRAELGGWSSSRVEWHTRLLQLQHIVPANVQIRRMSVRGEYEFIKPKPAPSADPAAAAAAAEGKPAPAASEGTPARRYYTTIDGRASGEQADQVVHLFVRIIQQSDEFRQVFEGAKLAGGLHQDGGSRGSGEAGTEWRFTIEAMSPNYQIK